MNKRALVAGIGEIYITTMSGYSPFTSSINTNRIQERLTFRQWNSIDPLYEENVTKSKILKSLETIQGHLKDDDTFLFYYNGHADKEKFRIGNDEVNGDDGYDEYLVTFSNTLITESQPYSTEIFLTDNDYKSAMLPFLKNNPRIRAISIFDCCYAKGMADGELLTQPNHLLIAASADNYESWNRPTEGTYLSQALYEGSKNSANYAELENYVKDFLTSRSLPEPYISVGASFINSKLEI